MVNFGFKKREHICSDKQITALFENGNAFIAYPLRVVFTRVDATRLTKNQILISVPKKRIKKAVNRNRVKRLIRESYRLNKNEFLLNNENNIDIAFLWIADNLVPMSRVNAKMRFALRKIDEITKKNIE